MPWLSQLIQPPAGQMEDDDLPLLNLLALVWDLDW
jgi:hypothetical protein